MSTKKAAAAGAADADGRKGVEEWLDHVTPDQRGLARRLDRSILEAIPDAVCAIKYRKPSNPLGTPFYGLAGGGWIASVNSLKAAVRLNLFAGRALKPQPPLATPPQARGIDLRSEDDLDKAPLKSWLQQAKKLPGWGRV